MTYQVDILGRPPIMRPLPKPQIEQLKDNWRGRRFITDTELDPKQAQINKERRHQRVIGIQERAKRRVCAHPGCEKQLCLTNFVGVCQKHSHQKGCACSSCAEQVL